MIRSRPETVLAIIEHHDLLAMIEQRKAGTGADQGRTRGIQGRPLGEGSRGDRAERLVAKKMVPQEDFEKASSLKKMCTLRGLRRSRRQIKMMKANINEMEYTRKYQMHIHRPV